MWFSVGWLYCPSFLHLESLEATSCSVPTTEAAVALLSTPPLACRSSYR